MVDPETTPLNPSSTSEEHDPEPAPYFEDTRDVLPTLQTPKNRRDPLYLLILYGFSFIVSVGGLGCALWAYGITVTGPFDERSKKEHRDGYESNFLGMQSVVVLLGINLLWSLFNFHLALKGRQISNELLWLVNTIYDFLLWATLIAFGVLNMVVMLWDRRLCDGLPRQGDSNLDKELYDKCDRAMFKLLVIEMVAVNLGLLVAVLHFILLIGRCCTCVPVHRSWKLRERIAEEEGMLLMLMERRQRLMEENEALEARSVDRVLPSVPAEECGNEPERETQQGEEDLIDMAAHAPDDTQVQ